MPKYQWALLPGHIIRASIPFSDVEGSKTRFPVVVSSEDFNKKYPEIIVAFTTRSVNIRSPRNYDVEISEHNPDFGLTNLPESTTVRCGRLWTISKKSIQECIGIVPNSALDEINHLVLECFK
ncbi:MAG: type II toxin-antitoxin system PemK/MazF family toxin [Planctomycetes bacterium]|nr:type II toxin-antitoxin system PemK/MazF family toxin [Planctomycetota bacterium]